MTRSSTIGPVKIYFFEQAIKKAIKNIIMGYSRHRYVSDPAGGIPEYTCRPEPGEKQGSQLPESKDRY
ncbi:hypothetical protein GCM10027051_23130 [Niabella terrae]